MSCTSATLSAFIVSLSLAGRYYDDITISRINRLSGELENGEITEAEAQTELENYLAEAERISTTRQRLFPVYFQTEDGHNWCTNVPAYTNGGAENKILDILKGKCRRVLAGAIDGADSVEVWNLYPDAQPIDCMEVYSLVR